MKIVVVLIGMIVSLTTQAQSFEVKGSVDASVNVNGIWSRISGPVAKEMYSYLLKNVGNNSIFHDKLVVGKNISCISYEETSQTEYVCTFLLEKDGALTPTMGQAGPAPGVTVSN